jgi:hypothetical protein
MTTTPVPGGWLIRVLSKVINWWTRRNFPQSASVPDLPDPASFPEVLSAELLQLRARRKTLFGDPPLPAEGAADERSAYAPAHRFKALGVTCSGGGIRSATLNLGILQGLSAAGVLPSVDYLSTVSGGGYIGSWLHGLIQRLAGGNPARATGWLSPRERPPHNEPADDPIEFLRKYSNYLAPRLGLFSGDFWVIFIIWLRNMMLNQLILIPFLGAVVLAAINLGLLEQKFWGSQSTWATGIWGIVLLSLSLLLAVFVADRNLSAIVRRDFKQGDGAKLESWEQRSGWCIVAVFFGAFWYSLRIGASLDDVANTNWLIVLAILFALFFGLQSRGGFWSCYREQHPRHRWAAAVHLVWMPAVCALVTTFLLWAADSLFYSLGSRPDSAWQLVAWGPPLLVLVAVIGVSLQIGLMGIDFPDSAREWLARIGARLSILSFAWAAVFAIGVFGPYWISRLALTTGATVAALAGGWIGTTAAGVLSGKSSKTGGAPDDTKRSGTMELIVKVAPTVFLIGFLLLIAFGVHLMLSPLAGISPAPDPDAARAACPSGTSWLSWLGPTCREYWAVLDNPYVLYVAFALLILLAILVGVLSSRININEFSMHHFYKNRLVRCYMGASRARARVPNPLTGFDSRDDMPIAHLLADPPPARRKSGPIADPYLGPYAIVNATLNLNAGSELAQQERKAASFVFTPLYCGFEPAHSKEDKRQTAESAIFPLAIEGFRRTIAYMKENVGPDIGTCMGISGAAANPNWGYHTSGPVAFLLTVFDVRLGWWLGNPRREGPSRRMGPRFALWWLLSELFGKTTGRSSYVNLSDGGHFENMGIYELVRRRCRYIIVGDGEEDAQFTFESLGGAVRKCRTDFNVEIDIHPERIRKGTSFSGTHCVVGTITYPEMEDGKPVKGWILYLKASLTGDEPEDVLQYHAAHPDFPHQSTLNQFFTESQFESYRRLGLHIARSAFVDLEFGGRPDALETFFQELWERWYPPSPAAPGVSTLHASAYSSLMKRLSDDPQLSSLDDQLFCPGPDSGKPGDPERERKEFLYCLDLIQLMENVWSDLGLEQQAERESPKNGGWMRVFRVWASQPAFLKAWERASYTYNPLFRAFFQSLKDPDPCGRAGDRARERV